MTKLKSATLLLAVALFLSANVHAEMIGGVEFPDGATSFADAVYSFNPGTGVSSPYNDPARALGIPDGTHVSLGLPSGELVLRFTDNSLTTSGDSTDDLWIFEVGPAVEATGLWVSTNAVDWISVGSVGGATSGVDIDAFIGSGIVAGELYSYVRLMNLENESGSPYAGADIDAVGAISSAAPAVPIPAAIWLLGSGLAGLAGLKRRFGK